MSLILSAGYWTNKVPGFHKSFPGGAAWHHIPYAFSASTSSHNNISQVAGCAMITSTRGISIFSLRLEFRGRIVLVVVKPKFVWRTHSEAKQTDTLESCAEKGLLRGPSEDYGRLMLKRPELSNGFQARVFKGKFWGEGCRVCAFLLIGWW